MVNEGRTRRAALGFVTDVGGTSVITAVNFIATPIILRLTSQSLYGFWITSISILGYLALTDLGLGMSLTRLVSGLTSTRDVVALNRVISTAFFAFCVVGLVFFSLGIAIAPLIPGWFKIPAEEAEVVVSAFWIAVLAGAVALPGSVFSGVVVGYQKMAIGNTAGSLVSLGATGLSILLLVLGIGLIALPLSNLFATVVTGLFCYYYARRCFPQLRISPFFVNRTDLKKLLSFGGYFQLGRIANTVAWSTDSIIIAGSMGVAQVTPYAFTSRLPKLFSQNLSSKLPIAVFPAMAELFANQRMEECRFVFQRLASISVRLAVLAGAFLLVANHQFVSLWLGPQNYGGEVLNLVLVYWVLLDTVYRGTSVVVHATGDLRKWLIACAAEAIVSLPLTLLLVGPLGIVGVALGICIGKTLTTGVYVPFWICRKLKLPVRVFLRESVLSSLLLSLPGVGLTALVSVSLPSGLGWLWIIIVALTASVGNMFFFEGLALCRPSPEPWWNRLRNLVAVRVQ